MKKFIAKAVTGREYLYDRYSAHMVPAASANRICSALNAARYRLKDHETWHVYEYEDGGYDGEYAAFQRFYIRSGKLFEA